MIFLITAAITDLQIQHAIGYWPRACCVYASLKFDDALPDNVTIFNRLYRKPAELLGLIVSARNLCIKTSFVDIFAIGET